MKILVLSCGGTIVSPDEATGKADSKAKENAAEWLIEMLETNDFKATLHRRANKRFEGKASPFHALVKLDPAYAIDKDSTNVGPEDWQVIIDKIVDNYDEYDGFLLPHGTNSLAYTANALSFSMLNLGKPIIMTASNVPIGVPYSDGPMNAANAVMVLQTMIMDGLDGVFTVFANRVMPGVRTKKSSGVDIKAFTTFNAPDVGSISKDEVTIDRDQYRKYRPRWIWGLEEAKSGEQIRAMVHRDFRGVISSHTFHPGDDPKVYLAELAYLDGRRRQAEHERGAMIIRAVGDGDVSDAIRERVFPEAKRLEIPIVVTTQEPQGVSSLKHNTVSEGAEEAYGIIPAHDMSIETMVVKLRYLLSKNLSYAEIHGEFLRDYLGEINIRAKKNRDAMIPKGFEA